MGLASQEQQSSRGDFSHVLRLFLDEVLVLVGRYRMIQEKNAGSRVTRQSRVFFFGALPCVQAHGCMPTDFVGLLRNHKASCYG